LGRFPDQVLFDGIGRALCEAECVPRKELYESWEVARRARRLFRGGRVVDVGGGHGLLAHIMLLLDDTSPAAVVVDPETPPSAAALQASLVKSWPRLADRVSYLTSDFSDVRLDSSDVVVSCHACGALTDRVIDAVIAARARVAVMPCCHDEKTCDTGGLTGWMDSSLAIDAVRVVHLRDAGFRVRTQVIPVEITPKNRLILAAPRVEDPEQI
jgi:hypothetical protein